MKRLMALIVMFGLMGVVLYAQDVSNDSATLKATIEQLKKENAKLREENQILRKLVAGTPSTSTSTETKTEATKTETPRSSEQRTQSTVTANDGQETGYWLTTSSSKRHNSKCRYYKTSNGRSCGANEGTACKICGG